MQFDKIEKVVCNNFANAKSIAANRSQTTGRLHRVYMGCDNKYWVAFGKYASALESGGYEQIGADW